MSNQFFISRKTIFLSHEPITLPVSPTDPGSATDGDMYYNSVSGQVKILSGGSWSFFQHGITIASGTVGQIPVYSATGTTLGQNYSQNLQNINLKYAEQPIRSVGLVYTIPNPGDGIAATNVLLSDGAISNLAVINKVLTGYASAPGTVAASDSILQALQKLDGNDTLRVLKTGDSMTGDLKFASGFGILNSAPGGTLNVGSDGNTSVINIGGASTIVNILGTLEYVQSTNTQITDSLITLNKGGGAASAGDSGLEIEEAGSITGFAKIASSRLSWDMQAPAALGIARIAPPLSNYIGTLSLGSPTANRTWSFPDVSGTVALVTGPVPTAANTALSNLASVAVNTSLLPGADAGMDLGSSSFKWNNLHAVSTKLYGLVTGAFTQLAADSTTSYSIHWPALQGAAGTVPLNDGAGNLIWQTIAASALIKVALFDPVHTALPTGTIVIDGVTVNANDYVLFSNLGASNNRVYKANGILTTITSWTVQSLFGGFPDPVNGDTVVVQQGTGYGNQIGRYYNSTWTFNDKVRYFNGTDYWEQTNLITSTLTNNTVGNVFTVSYLGTENIIVDYSILRGTAKETGTLHIVTDGTTVNVTTSGAYLNATGVTFSGDISGGTTLRLRYTTTLTGFNATMKYMLRRWSDNVGGPAGPPNYTGFTFGGGGGGTPGGVSGDIQYNDGSGGFAGVNIFKIDVANQSLNLNGLYETPLSAGLTLLDNTSSATALLTLDATNFNHIVLEYSIVRNGESRTGRLLVSNNGTVTGFSDDYVETAVTGVLFSSDIMGSNVRILYTTSNSGFNATFKYALRRWS